MTQLCGSISVVSMAVKSLDYGVRAAPVMDTSGLRAQAPTDQQVCGAGCLQHSLRVCLISQLLDLEKPSAKGPRRATEPFMPAMTLGLTAQQKSVTRISGSCAVACSKAKKQIFESLLDVAL